MESANESDRVLNTEIINHDDCDIGAVVWKWVIECVWLCDDIDGNDDVDDDDAHEFDDDVDGDIIYQSRLKLLLSLPPSYPSIHPSINYLVYQLLIDQVYYGKQQLQVQHLSSMAQEKIY